MSFAEDLRRNRSIFRKLSSGAPAGESPDIPAPADAFREVLREERGAVAEPVFAQALVRQEDTSAPLSYGVRPVQSLAGTAPVPAAMKGLSEASAQIYRIGSLKDSPMLESAQSLQYPEPQGDSPSSAEADGDLLDALVRRMEASARRYPQDLAQEGGEPW